MGLKDIYYYFEEKYYAALDRLDEFIPVNGLVDKIDKVMPSFALFLVLLALLVVFGALFFTGGLLGPQTASLEILVEDNGGRLIENATVSLTGSETGIQKELKTLSNGKTLLENVIFGARIDVIVEKMGFKRYITSIVLDEERKTLSVRLEPEILPPPPHTIIFAGPDGQKLVGVEINAHF